MNEIVPYNKYSLRFKAAIDIYQNILLTIDKKESFKYVKIEQYSNEGSRSNKDTSECLSETYYVKCLSDSFAEFQIGIYNPFSFLYKDNKNYPNIRCWNSREHFPVGAFDDVVIITLAFDETDKSRICTFIFNGLK